MAEAPWPHAGVFFPTMRNPTGAVPESLARGVLALSEKGCLLIMPRPARVKKFPRALRDYPGTVPLWPSYFELDTGGGEVRVLNEDGRVVAQVGKRVWMGGGQIGEKTLRGNDLMGERELAEFSERCPDDYWMVGENPHIPGRKG